MEIVRRADVDDVDVRILRDFTIVRNAFRVQKLTCGGGRFRTARADMRNLRLEWQFAEEERQILMGERMDFAYVTKTNYTDTIGFHELFLDFSVYSFVVPLCGFMFIHYFNIFLPY